MSDPQPQTPTLQLTPKARLALYLFSAIGSILVAYGSAKGWGWFGEAELGAWASVVALINGLAAMNVRSGPR